MIKKLWIEFKSFTTTRQQLVDGFILFWSAAILIFSFCVYAGVLFQYSTSKAILQSIDGDSSYGVETAINTNWVNHNGSTNYGPLYYRLAAPIRHFVDSTLLTNGLSKSEAQFKNVHFHLLLLNLLSVFAMSFVFSLILTPFRPWQLLITSVMPAMFLSQTWRAKFLIMANTDHLLALLVTIGVLLFYMGLSETDHTKHRRWLFYTALCWALASLTKLTTVFFAPSLLIFIYLLDPKKLKNHLLFFSKWFLLFYFVLGFPQSLDLWGSLKPVIRQNGFTSLVNLDFLLNQWLVLFIDDLFKPFLFILACLLIVPFRTAQISQKALMKTFVLVLLPIVFLVSKKTTAPFQWYTFPFANALLVAHALFIVYLGKLIFKGKDSFKKSPWLLVLFFAAFPLSNQNFPQSIDSNFYESTACRSQAEVVRNLINNYAQQGRPILTDPLFPYDPIYFKNSVNSLWDMNWQQVADNKTEVLGLKSSYYRLFLVPGAPEVRWLTDKSSQIAFYQSFLNTDQAKAPDGSLWQLKHKDSCDFEVWVKQQ